MNMPIKLFSSTVLVALSIAMPALAQTSQITVAWFGGANAEAFQKCYADPFTAQTGIKVLPEIGTSNVTFSKLQQQRDNPTIDVAIIDGGISELAYAAGVIDILDEQRIPNLANVKDKAIYRAEDGVFAVGTGFFSVGIAYNTAEIADAPTSWKDLWKPEYAGAVTIPSPANTAGVPFLFFLTNVWGGDTENLDAVFANVKKLDVGLYFESSGAATNAFQNGEAVIGALYSNAAWEMADRGLPIGFIVPKEGAWSGDGRIHLVKGSRNKEAAELFINSTLTVEASSCIATRLYREPSVKGASVPAEISHKLPWGPAGSAASLITYDWNVINAQRAAISDRWNREIVGSR